MEPRRQLRPAVLSGETLEFQAASLGEVIVAKVVNLTSQTRKLGTARDLLLPRVMSGEIAV